MKANKVKLVCQFCKTEFHVKASKASTAKFCSRKCKDESQWTRPKNTPRPCIVCGKEFTPDRHHGNARFCSKSCQGKTTPKERMKEIANTNLERRAAQQRGKGEGRGYRKYMGRHEHRVIAEKMLGRPLEKGEIVHHKDGNKLNNSPDNLQVMTQSEHCKEHHFGKSRRKNKCL